MAEDPLLKRIYLEHEKYLDPKGYYKRKSAQSKKIGIGAGIIAAVGLAAKEYLKLRNPKDKKFLGHTDNKNNKNK